MAWYNPLSWDTFTGANVPSQLGNRDQINSLIGGGMGDPNAGYWAQDITHFQAPQMQAAQAGPAAQLQLGQDPFRQAQLQQLGQLQGIASGQRQGAAELGVQRQIANALAAQQAQARMARGGNAALAYRNAANQSAALGLSGAGLGQQAAMQDQMNAQGLLGQVGAQGRGADISVAGQNAGFQQQTGLQNAGFQQDAAARNAAMAQQGQQMNSQNYLSLLGQAQGLGQAELAAGQQKGMSQNQSNRQLIGGLISGGGQLAGAAAGGGGGAAMASDERLKTDVSDARGDIDAMLEGLKPVAWNYKDERHGQGRWTGIMAQDMERSAAGARIVSDTPDGKMLDVRKAVSASLAASARLHERLRALEKGR